MKETTGRTPGPTPGVTLRAVILGLLLIPANTYFIMANGIAYGRSFPTTVSIMFNVVITLTVLIIINSILKFLWPRSALKQGELLTVHIMLCLSSAISGFDIMQTLVVMIPGGHWFATPENEFRELFWQHLPEWLTISDPAGLQVWYKGESSLYTKEHLLLWLSPIIWWTVSLSVLIWVMLCLDVLLRKQWIDHEKLSYPIIQLPLTMTYSDNRFFKSRMMWMGLGIAAAINLLNGLNALYPSIPGIPLRQMNIGRYITEKPWSAMGSTPMYILPFAIGLGYLMPLEMSFSIWFFYLFWKLERVIGSALGLFSLPGFPYYGPQGLGAYLALVLFALIGGRRYFYAILRRILRPQPDEDEEPMRYRWAVVGLLGGLAFLVIFSYQAGMAVWTAVLYFLIYCLLAVSLCRIRAEVGPPTHELAMATPRRLLVQTLGTRRISPPSLTIMTLYISFHRYYRSHPMPHTLEGFKLATEAKMNNRRLVWVMMLTTVVGILVAFWAYLAVAYRSGGDPYAMSTYYGFTYLQSWLSYPTEADGLASAFTVGAFLFVGLLWWLRRVFPFWPFHPAGYAIASSTWTMGMLWFSIFISWLTKNTILRFGGIRLYRKAFPFFLGLLLGEYLVGGAWVVIGVLFNVEVYSFYR
ncbi:DUF6785 family protein [Candidatus Poribacteria bacterium]